MDFVRALLVISLCLESALAQSLAITAVQNPRLSGHNAVIQELPNFASESALTKSSRSTNSLVSQIIRSVPGEYRESVSL